jgi:hypothetical protein
VQASRPAGIDIWCALRNIWPVRTTLTLDEDVYVTARAFARQRGVSLGTVISELSRQGMKGGAITQETRNNIRLFPRQANARPVTPDVVKQLLDGVDLLGT